MLGVLALLALFGLSTLLAFALAKGIDLHVIGVVVARRWRDRLARGLAKKDVTAERTWAYVVYLSELTCKRSRSLAGAPSVKTAILMESGKSSPIPPNLS